MDSVQERCDLARPFCDHVVLSSPSAPATLASLMALTDHQQGFEKTMDCSGSSVGRNVGLKATHQWGSMVLVGEGGSMEMMPSDDLIHQQKSLLGSWVSPVWRMQELVKRLVRWDLHPEDMVTHRFKLDQAAEAYKVMAEGKCGKVAVVWD